MKEILDKITTIGIIPVVTIENAKNAVPLAKALGLGGVPIAEIAFRTASAAEAIKEISGNCPDVIAAAGTILTKDQVDDAVSAGAKFISSPGTNPKIVEYCQHKKIAIIPGVATPSDIDTALNLGLDIVKLFPAEPLGGIEMVKSLAAPYTGVKFIPTGGIRVDKIAAYLKLPRVPAVGASFLAPKDLIAAGQFNKITEICRETMFRLRSR